MNCKNDKCSNEVMGKQVFCSDKCRKATSRTDNSDKPNSDIIESVRVITPAMLDSLPAGVSRPTAQPTPETAGAHAAALMDGMNRCSGIDWLNSPEYAEVVYRLLTCTAQELEQAGQFVPCWKGAA